MDVVIVPVWRRAGFLAATLRRLLSTDDGAVRYLISADRRADRAVLDVARRFTLRLGLTRAGMVTRAHAYRGNSYNVLTSYTEALTLGPDLVHLVEEDVFVGADYLDAHRAAHRIAPDAFAVSVARNQNAHGDPTPDPGAVYLHGSYQSVAVSFRPDMLAAILPHVTPAYFRDPVTYCRRTWPRTTIPAGHAEQDGLIHRIIEARGAMVAYAALPRAYHAGFQGYHRKGLKLVGTPDQQADRLLAMGTAELNAAAHSYPDHQAVDLDARPGEIRSVMVWP